MMKLEGMAQRMYEGARNTVAAVALAGAASGCSTVMYDIKPYNHNISQWPGISHVSKVDKGLADRMVKFNDVGPASRELTYVIQNNAENKTYVALRDQLIKDGHVEEGVDGAVVIAYAVGTYITIKTLKKPKRGSGTACTNVFDGGTGTIVCK
jgi:hypothetical protein